MSKLCEEEERFPEEDYVLEEAVDGVEYGVDAVMDGSGFRMILLRRKLLTPPPARQAVGYMAVSSRESEESRRLCERVEACLTEVTALLGLQNCLLHADLMTGDGYVFPIELSARLPATISIICSHPWRQGGYGGTVYPQPLRYGVFLCP